MGETDKDDLISIIDDDDFDEDLPTSMPLMPVRDVVIFTDMLIPLFVGRDKSINAVESAVEKDSIMMLSTQKDPGIENPSPDDIYSVGTVGRILRMLKLPDGRVKALVQGVAKAKITKYVRKRPLYKVDVEIILEEPAASIDVETEALMRNVREQSEKILALRGELTNEIGTILESIEDPGKLADLVASNLKMRIEDAQALLETLDPLDRLRKINDILSKKSNSPRCRLKFSPMCATRYPRASAIIFCANRCVPFIANWVKAMSVFRKSRNTKPKSKKPGCRSRSAKKRASN